MYHEHYFSKFIMYRS